MNINWFWMIIFLVMMTTIGFVVFDNIGASIAFGLGTGIYLVSYFPAKSQKRISNNPCLFTLQLSDVMVEQ